MTVIDRQRDILEQAMKVKLTPETAETVRRSTMRAAANVVSQWSLDDARRFVEAGHGAKLASVLDSMVDDEDAKWQEWDPPGRPRAALVQNWLQDAAGTRRAPSPALVGMLKEAVGVAATGRKVTAQAATRLLDEVADFRELKPNTQMWIAGVQHGLIGEVWADYDIEDAKKFAATPQGHHMVKNFEGGNFLTTPQLKRMGKRWGMKMGRLEGHIYFMRRMGETLAAAGDAPPESAPEPAPTRRRGRRAEARTEEPAPKKRGGGRKAADHAWQPVEGKPGRRKRKLPSGRWHYEDVPLQKADERRGAYLMRVLRWHLERMREVV